MNKTFIEGAGIKQLDTIKFTHSLPDCRRGKTELILLHNSVFNRQSTSCKDR